LIDIRSVECFLVDMDGTLYIDDHLLPGAREFVEIVRKSGRRLIFLTNNSSKSPQIYASKLCSLGIETSSEDIFTSGEATADYIKERMGHSRIYLIGTKALADLLMHRGHIIVNEDPDVVVLGYDTELTYEKLAKGCFFLREGINYIATHGDINCPSLMGPVPDAGSLISLINCSTNRLPDVVIGKPNPLMMEMLKRRFHVNKSRIAMIGDRLYTDMEFAHNSGITSILVLSGETTRRDLQSVHRFPDVVIDEIGDLIPYVKSKV